MSGPGRFEAMAENLIFALSLVLLAAVLLGVV